MAVGELQGSQIVGLTASEVQAAGILRGGWECMGDDVFGGTRMHRWVADDEEQTDYHRAKSIVDRRTHYTQRTRGHWSDDMRRIAMGVVIMRTTREVNAQEKVQFPHIAFGVTMIRTHGGQTFFRDDGAPHLFVGVAPVYMISR